MGELLTATPDVEPSLSGPESQAEQSASLSYGERLRRRLGSAAEGAFSFIDMAAGIALARDDLRRARNTMRDLDASSDGIIGRQAAGDQLSMELESDIVLDMQREAQSAGFSDMDVMSDEMRAATATQAVGARRDDIASELAAAHPEWSAEEVQGTAASRAADMAALLGMSSDQANAYLAAQSEYHELKSTVPEIETELDALRAERKRRLSRIGGAALRGVVSFAGRVRNLPSALGARATVAGMAFSDRIRSMSPENRRKAFWGTAAGVALAGLAGYVAVRSGLGHHGAGSGSSNYTLVDTSSPLSPEQFGGDSAPQQFGEPLNPYHLGTYVTPDQMGGGADVPVSFGGSRVVTPDQFGGPAPGAPDQFGGDPSVPQQFGGAGSARTVEQFGDGSTPIRFGGASLSPDQLGGADTMAQAQSSGDLFTGSATVDKWPSVITVDHWNPRTHDGSLTGISEQMLIRSGVAKPTASQVNTLIDALRPQAQPNGYLLYGQKLDLRPAAKALQDILRK